MRAVINSAHRKLVIAADDSPEILFLLSAMLNGAGCNFMGASSGAELLTLSYRVVPRLILLDIEMPDLNGIETCRRLRANADQLCVPIAFLTGRKTFEDVTEDWRRAATISS